MTAARRRAALEAANRRTLTDRAFDALGWALSRAVVGIALTVVTWVVLDVGMRLLIRAGAGDAGALLVMGLITAFGLGWAAGRPQE